MADDGYVYTRWNYPVEAAKVAPVVERLAAENGGVCPPRLFVEHARPVDSEIHRVFDENDWNDAWAGEEYRVGKARRIISSIHVVTDGQVHREPAFTSARVTTEVGSGRGYMATWRAMSVESTRVQVLRDAFRQFDGLRRRFETLSEFKAVWEAVDEAMERTGGN